MSFNNMSKPIPNARRDVAYQWVRDMGIERAQAFSLVEAVSNHLERDHPHEAMEEACKVIDLTGAYRLLATLLTDPK